MPTKYNISPLEDDHTVSQLNSSSGCIGTDGVWDEQKMLDLYNFDFKPRILSRDSDNNSGKNIIAIGNRLAWYLTPFYNKARQLEKINVLLKSDQKQTITYIVDCGINSMKPSWKGYIKTTKGYSDIRFDWN